MANKLAKAINKGYRSRYARKSAKGIGVYASQPAGAGPNGVHVQFRSASDVCRCGGCSAKGKVA